MPKDMTDRRKVRQLMKFWAALAAIAAIIGYAGFRSVNLVSGPELVVLAPENGSLLSDPVIRIRGVSRNISFLTLNDGKIFTDESGNFEEEVLLSYGYNAMTLKAKDRFGREETKTLELIYK